MTTPPPSVVRLYGVLFRGVDGGEYLAGNLTTNLVAAERQYEDLAAKAKTGFAPPPTDLVVLDGRRRPHRPSIVDVPVDPKRRSP